jgi:RNA polymerase sigma-70 factor, ECF subfamily
MESPTASLQSRLSEIYQQDARRIYATLVRLLGNFDLAEDMLQEAFIAAAEQWPEQGIPTNTSAWLITVARNKGLDRMRRNKKLEPLEDELLETESALHYEEEHTDPGIEDDRLRLIFTCCHPALDRQVQLALTLREVCGLTTEAIASAFLLQPATLAQRIVRGKNKIRTAGIPYVIPEADQLDERLDAVLSVIYLMYNEGYNASSGQHLNRPELSAEAIRLGRLLVMLLPAAECYGLLALMLLNEARRLARSNEEGELILLEHQDRSLWNQDYIREGLGALDRAFSKPDFGSYTLQAAIAALHSEASSVATTDWTQIVYLYDRLLQLTESPVVALNRAVAVSMRDGPQAGIDLIETLFSTNALSQYYLAHAAHADFSVKLGLVQQARASYQKALTLVQQEPERRFLEARLASLDPQ